MNNMLKKSSILIIVSFFAANQAIAQPKGFVYLKDIDPTIIEDLRYPTYNNLVGRPIAGYEHAHCILTKRVALALSQVQKKLKPYSMSLKIFDCYRPKTAVDDYMAWMINPYNQQMQEVYYPNISKADIVKTGYLTAQSSHMRGGSVDVTIVYLPVKAKDPAIEVAMGTTFGFLDEDSSPKKEDVKDYAKHNRSYLRQLMQDAGFKPDDKVWWHFTFKNEQYPHKEFDFKIR